MKPVFLFALFTLFLTFSSSRASADEFGARVCRVYDLNFNFQGQFYFQKNLDEYPDQKTVYVSRVNRDGTDEIKKVKSSTRLIDDYKHYQIINGGRWAPIPYSIDYFLTVNGASIVDGTYDSAFISPLWLSRVIWNSSQRSNEERMKDRLDFVYKIGSNRLLNGYVLKANIVGGTGVFLPLWAEPGNENQETCDKVRTVLGSVMTDALVWIGRNKLRPIFTPDTDR